MCCCILTPDKMPPVIFQGALSYDRKSLAPMKEKMWFLPYAYVYI